MSKNVTLSTLALVLACVSPAAAQTASCKPIFDGLDKVMTTPTHIYRTVPRENGAVQTGEAIYAGGGIYQRSAGTWEKIPITIEKARKQEQETRTKTSNTCRMVKPDTVNGEAVTLYELKTVDGPATSNAQVWIAKSNGRILKQEIDIDAGKGGKVHYSVRYEYDKVEPPQM